MTTDTPSLAAREVLEFIAHRLLMAGYDRAADKIYVRSMNMLRGAYFSDA